MFTTIKNWFNQGEAVSANSITIGAAGGTTGHITITGAGGGGGGGGVTIGGGVAGSIYHGAGTTTPITVEEEKELNILKNEFRETQRQEALTQIKKMPVDIRDFLYNLIKSQELLESISKEVELNIKKSQRHINLESKISMWSYGFINSHSNLKELIALPDYITIEDFKQACVDAAMEEQLLK